MNTKKQLLTGVLVLLAQLFIAQNNKSNGLQDTRQIYCESTNENPRGQHITEVGFSGVRNTTTYNNGYEFYEFNNVNVTKGPYTNLNEAGLITIKVETAWRNTKVGYWVDWNQDGDFDDASEEMILSNVKYPTKNEWLSFFVVPDSAKLGRTRMRVRAVYADQISSCGDEWFGETEDYMINVVASRSKRERMVSVQESIAFPNPSTNGNFTFSFNKPTTNITFKVFNSNGILIRSILNQSTIDNKLTLDLSDFNSGIYTVQTISRQALETTRLVIQ